MACAPPDDASSPPHLGQVLPSVSPANPLQAHPSGEPRVIERRGLALPPPSPEALARAAPLFASLMGAKPRPLGPPAQVAATARAERTPDQQKYPLADAMLPPAQDAAFKRSAKSAPPKGPSSPRQAETMGFVRGSVPSPKPVETVSQKLLEEVAQAAQVGHTGGQQGHHFDIVFREELLGALQCRLAIGPNKAMTATFLAADAHTARLLRAETGRLRLQFEERGMSHVTIVVHQEG
jgi:hypothetical protein